MMTEQDKPLRIVFMGTPEFAVPALDILYRNFGIVAVVTAPDKPAGRGLKLQQSAVKAYAVAHELPVLQPQKLKDPAFLEQLHGLGADIQVVVAFRMLPEVVWDMPRLGTINLHASLLPDYRGAAPINWAIINGETETGVTTFKLQHEIDTGEIIFSEKVPIAPGETAGELHDQLMETGAGLLLKTIRSIALGTYQLTAQETPGRPASVIKHAPKIFKEDCRIAWDQESAQVHNLIRGLSPYPTAWTSVNGKTLKVFRSRRIPDGPPATPGSVETDHRTFLHVAVRDGWIALDELQLEGKKRMPAGEFLRGFREQQLLFL